MSDLDELQTLDADLDDLLDAGETGDDYQQLVKRRDQLVAQLDSDDAKGAERVKAVEQRQKTAELTGSAAEQIETLKANIALLHGQRDAVAPGMRNPDGSVAATVVERAELAVQVDGMEDELRIMEARLPYVDLDDETAEQTVLTVMAEAEKAKAELAALGATPGYIGTRQLLERQIEAAESKAAGLKTDVAVRKEQANRTATVRLFAEQRAMRKRREALEAWQAAKRTAESNAQVPGGDFTEYDRVLEAGHAIRAINNLPETPTDAELAPHIAEFTGQPPRGAWR